MSDANATAQQLATATPADGDRVFTALSPQEQVEVILAAAELGLTLKCTVRCAAFARALKTLPALSALPDEQYFACYPARQVRLRHAWNGELEPSPCGGGVAVVAVRRTVDGLQHTPLMVSTLFAPSVIRTGATDAEVEVAIKGAEPLPGVVARSDVKAVR